MDDVKRFIQEMGHRMAIQRKKLGLTQEQVAELADISPQLLSTAENGTRAISADKLFRISRALNVSADYLLSGEITEKDKTMLLEKIRNADEVQLHAIADISDIIMNMKK